MGKSITIEEIKKHPEADLVVNYIADRKKKGLYSLVLVPGLPGSGKSSQCCRLGEKITEQLTGKNTFTAKHITDNFLGFVRFVRDAKPDEVNVIVVEEISVLFPSRRAMSGENVDLAKVLDTCRKKQVIILANAPIWTSIDSHMRSMANIYIQAMKVYKKAQIVYSKFYKLQTDPRTGKTYTHNFKRNNKDVNRMWTGTCDPDVWAEYEGKKDSFLEEIYNKAEARAMLRALKDKKDIDKIRQPKSQGLNPKEIVVLDYVKTKGYTQVKTAEIMGISGARISQILKSIKEKTNFVECEK